VRLEVADKSGNPNDYVGVRGRYAANEFLQKVGVKVGQQDLTREGTAEAKLASKPPDPGGAGLDCGR